MGLSQALPWGTCNSLTHATICSYLVLMQDKPQPLPIRTRFPAPWRAEKQPSGYCVVSANGKKVAFIYEEAEPIRRNMLHYPTVAEARSIATAIATLPDIIAKLEGST